MVAARLSSTLARLSDASHDRASPDSLAPCVAAAMRLVIHRLTVAGWVYPATREQAARQLVPWRPRLVGRSWDDTPEGIASFFEEVFGWRDVYHFLIYPDRARQWCPLDKRGAHAAPFNTGSWGLAAIGDWRTQEPSVEQWGLAVDTAAKLLWSESTWPDKDRLIGHGELPGISKDCPGAGWPMDRFRHDVTAGVVELHREMGMVSPGERRALLGWG